MTATATTPAAEARERYLAAYRTFAADRELYGDANVPAWWRELRERAIARFAATGFPTTRQEEWRFTSVAPIVAAAYPIGGGLTRVLPTPEGVVLHTFGAWAVAGQAAVLQAHVGRYAKIDANPFVALATAFMSDGVVIQVPAGKQLDAPIFLTHSPRSSETLTIPRLLVVLERGARATIVERFESAPDSKHVTNAIAEIVLGEGAHCEYVRVQQESPQAYHLATIHSHQERDSALHSTSVVFGGALARQDVTAVLGGSGASLMLNGLSVVGGIQHVDHHTTIEHAQPHCESHELFNGIFDGHSRGVFNGRIIVRPGAQRTDSKQTSNNLLLSADARADTQPQLEIYADDVKCTHGATLGPLDPSALFYLASRGIGPAEARGLLTYGFGADILTRISTPAVREALDRVVRERLGISVPAAA